MQARGWRTLVAGFKDGIEREDRAMTGVFCFAAEYVKMTLAASVLSGVCYAVLYVMGAF